MGQSFERGLIIRRNFVVDCITGMDLDGNIEYYISLLKCFPGARFMKVGGGLGSEGTLSSIVRVRPFSRVSGYPSLGEKI